MSAPTRDPSRAFTGGVGLLTGGFIVWLGWATSARGAQGWGGALTCLGVYFAFSGGKHLVLGLSGPPPAKDAPLTRADRLQAALGALASLAMVAAAAFAEARLGRAERVGVGVLFGFWALINLAALFAK